MKTIAIVLLILIIAILLFRKTSPMDPLVVTLFADCNFSGQSVSVGVGDYYSMDKVGFPNDALSSIKIPTGLKVTLYENNGFGGSSLVSTSDIACLNTQKLKYVYNWNDRVSSFRVARI